MAISEEVAVITNALWPQGDIRDPLGVWGFRHGITGDATGGSIKVGAVVPADNAGAFLFTCYSALAAILAQATTSTSVAKVRLLTNWPNVDPQLGVQAYGSAGFVDLSTVSSFTPPEVIPTTPMIAPQDRFLLLFDPRPSGGQITIVELEIGVNILADTYTFEGYGYYWDRSVLNAPGGPRHPGSS